MADYQTQSVKRELIMKHYTSPNNKGDINSFPLKIEEHSRVCADRLHLGITINDNIIEDIKFEGEGCAVFLSSTDIMLDEVKGKTVKQAHEIADKYVEMLNSGNKADELNKLNIFTDVKTHLNRLHCAEIVAIAIKKIT